jgi:hypothetical protein
MKPLSSNLLALDRRPPLRIGALAARVLEGFREPARAIADAFATPSAEPALQRVRVADRPRPRVTAR